MKSHPIPRPLVLTAPLYKWAVQVVNYLTALEKEIETPSPKSIQLEHRKENAKATTDGLMMWCPVEGTIIVAKGGQWYPVELGAPLLVAKGIKHNV